MNADQNVLLVCPACSRAVRRTGDGHYARCFKGHPEIDMQPYVPAGKPRIPDMPHMALRPDSQDPEQMDDVVVVAPSMFRAEMMSEGVLWMACYFPDDDSDGVVFHVSARKKGVLDFSVTGEPAQWHDIDTDPREPLDPSRIDLSVLLQQHRGSHAALLDRIVEWAEGRK